MKNFKQLIILNKEKEEKLFDGLYEKVSKKEINDGLKNKNLQVGIEYEFIFDDNIFKNDEITASLRDFRRLQADVSKMWLLLDGAKEKYDKKMHGILYDTIMDYEKIYDDLKKENDPEAGEYLDLLSSLEDMRLWVQYSDMYNMENFTDIEVEWSADLPEEFSWDSGFSISLTSDRYENYFYYLYNILGIEIDFVEVEEKINNGIYDNEDMDEIYIDNNLYEPIPIDGKYMESDDWNEVFNNYDMQTDYLPFDGDDAVYYDVNEPRYNLSDWGVGGDSSLSRNGCEITSPILNIKDTIKSVNNMFKFITINGSVDKSCGLHVNMSYKDRGFGDFDFLKLMMFMDEGIIWKLFGERKNNIYAMSVIDAIRRSAGRVQKIKIDSTPLKYIIEEFKKRLKIPTDKYFGVNIINVGRGNRIEFRYLGGSKYNQKSKFVIAQIGRYSHYMQLGFDKNYKKNEYSTKIIRLYNKYYDKYLQIEEK